MGPRELTGDLDAAGMHIGIAVATFHAEISDGLLVGARDLAESAGADSVTVVKVPGSFELPLVASGLIKAGCDAVVALGAVIRGDTDHYDHVAHRASEGLMRVALDLDVPVAFGILTADDPEAALVRSRPGDGNKGAEAADAAIRTAQVLQALRAPR
ncbi:MAG: 6,7-dimethyl-8-ribityllumazine synthase [Acidimicrobiia bacterium]|nr:6,7-dimethyl-8-ribityllumazine synthase [Acidimicrobiia bacterium]NNC74407.1 6,7-dimethyl-8-ribityllumazine synthase [Acidimicrobiia bacterium]